MKSIFIGGCDRSGTTLLGSLLGASPGAVCTPESQFKTEILEGGNPAEMLRSPSIALTSIRRHWRFSLWGISESAFRGQAGRTGSYRTLIDHLVTLYAQRRHPHGYRFEKPTAWVDHTPSNVRYLDRLFSIFQDAAAIHIVRDGRAVAASILPLDWGPNTAHFAAKWWAQKLAPGLAAERCFGPEKVLRVRYEDLLADPEAELKRICRFAGIPYTAKMLRVSGFRVPDYTAGQHSRVQAGSIDQDRAGRWRQLLTRRQIAHFEYVAADLLSCLGYDLRQRWPAMPSKAALAKEGLEEVVCRLGNHLRKLSRKRRFLRKPSAERTSFISGKRRPG